MYNRKRKKTDSTKNGKKQTKTEKRKKTYRNKKFYNFF